MISILSVVKGRYDITLKSFHSIWNNCHDSNNIEHIAICDDNDNDMLKLLNEYSDFCTKNNYRFKFFTYHVTNDEDYKYRSMHRDYWNRIAMQANGDIIFGLCNDTIIDTKNYDVIMQNAVNENIACYNHSLFQIFIDDDWPIEDKYNILGYYYCSWIILTKDCLQIFNGIAPDEISSQGADSFVSALFQSSPVPAVINLIDAIKTIQISVQKGNYDINDTVNTSRPIIDSQRKEWTQHFNKLFVKKYYHKKLYNLLGIK
jgi:hypothetical protein